VLRIIGHVDSCNEALIEGWITIPGTNEPKLSLEFVLDDVVIGRCVADQFRQDLKSADLGDGHCAFYFPIPPLIPKRDISRILVRLENSSVLLPVDSAKPTESTATTSETISRFGGLWIDRYDWLDRLAMKHRKGEVSDDLSAAIFRFVRDGYLVIKGAVSPAVVDRVNEDIDRFWISPPAGLVVETFGPDSSLRVMPPDLSVRDQPTKMLDLYTFSSAAREAITSPQVIEFLSAIFEDEPKAFQGLTFWNGSQQAIHKDSAYVKIDSNPMHLAATWLALEDIQPGTGELEYYIGSHRAPDFLFGGSHKWMESHPEEHDRFLQSLHDDAKALGHLKGSFLARKGDVLIWHADLAHGGSPISQPSLTRKSLVTHFTPSADEPFYRRDTSYREAEQGGARFVSAFGDVGAPIKLQPKTPREQKKPVERQVRALG
jgi:phytanoyl-CoA hydroxylase